MKTEWDLSPLFKNDNDYEMKKEQENLEEATNYFVKKWRVREDYLSDAKILKEALDEYEKLVNYYDNGGKEGYYFWLRAQGNQNDSDVKARRTKIDELSRKMSNEVHFFSINLSKITKELQKKLLSGNELDKYRHFLERLFGSGEYTLSDAEERILTLKSPTSYDNWKRMLTSLFAKEEKPVSDSKGNEVIKNFSEISSLINDNDKKVRDSAAAAFNEILLKHIDIAEAEINSILENRKINDELRKFSRPDKSRHLSDDIESEVVDALVKSVSRYFSIAEKYYALKAKLLKMPKLAYHERNAEYGSISKDYKFEDAVRIIDDVFAKVDPYFSKTFREFLDRGQVDVFPRKGKRNGAFCVWWSPSMPVYVAMNYTNQLCDITTLAHEFGHAINAELSRKQNALNFNTPTSTTEVASTFMEEFVFDELLKETDDETRLALLVSSLGDDVGTIIRQIACYKFEQELHATREKGYLSNGEIGKIFQKNMAAYMGKAVIQSPGSENWWVAWSHIRTYFYVYSYASGLLIAKSLHSKVMREPEFINTVKEIFSSGCSQSPLKLFRKAGIDIANDKFWEDGLNNLKFRLENAEKLAKKLGKL